MLADVSATMSSKLQRHCTHISLLKKICFHCVFPQLPIQHSNECMRGDTLIYDPVWLLDGKCHKTQSKTNRHPYIKYKSYLGKLPPNSICLLSTCALTTSLRGAVRPLPLLLGGVCPLLREGSQRQCLRQSTVFVGSAHHPKWGADWWGGADAQGIGLSYW